MKILICGEEFPEATDRLTALLPEHEIARGQVKDLDRLVGEVDVVVPLITRLSPELMERGRFGLIQQFGVGLEVVDLAAASHAGVWVARVPSSESGNAASVAEHAMMFMMMLSRRLPDLNRAFQDGLFGQPTSRALLGKTACIVGLGGIGRALARRLRACEMRLVAVHEYLDREVDPALGIERVYGLGELSEAVATADYVVICLNYSPGRRNLIGHREIAAMKPGVYIVNIARGGLLDPDALLPALESGHVAGAGLDVFWKEPVDPRHPIFSQNVVATPHVAGVTDASIETIAAVVAENIRRYSRGELPLYAANNPPSPRVRLQ